MDGREREAKGIYQDIFSTPVSALRRPGRASNACVMPAEGGLLCGGGSELDTGGHMGPTRRSLPCGLAVFNSVCARKCLIAGDACRFRILPIER